MAADNNYYGYSYNVAPSQYSAVTGNSAYATGMQSDHTMSAQSAYPQSQAPVQYGPYGTRSQATAMPASQGFGEASLQYYGAVNADSYYTQKTQSQSASAAYQTGSSYDQSYASVNQNAASLDWQQQMKQAYSQSYNSSFVHGQSDAINSGTGYAAAAAAAASDNQYSSATSVNQYSSSPSAYQYNSALSVSQYSSTPSVYQYSSTSSGNQFSTASSVNQNSSATNTAVSSVSSYSGLDAAVYSAATDYLIQKQKGDRGSNWYKNFKESHGSPDHSQWKYCELCKCSCAGIWAYKAHLSGKAHKKREQMGPAGESVNPATSNENSLTCQLCDVVCSSTDAYAAHMRGLKHQRILKLQLKMGKPIPELMSLERVAAKEGANTATSPPAKIPKTTSASGTKMAFRTRRTSYAESKHPKAGIAFDQSAEEQSDDSQLDLNYDIEDKNAQPIGLEYIEESLNETCTAPIFYCKLCDCSFTDPLAKAMHTKGRRHRFQYKKKVDPLLKVDMKVAPFNSRTELDKINRRNVAGEFWWRQKELQESYKQEAEDLRYEKELLQWQLEKTVPKFDSVPPSWAAIDFDLSDEKPCLLEMEARHDTDYINAKHTAIYPTEEDLLQVQRLVSTCEKALKLVSDRLSSLKIEKDLKGVMRVGRLAKGLLLHDSLDFELVVLCSYRPTQLLLKDIMDGIPVQLKTFTGAKYKLELAPDASGFIFSADQEEEQKVKIKCTVSLTSSAVTPYSESVQKSAFGNDVYFDVQPCLKALAALRHAKWFQAKAANLHPCVIVIRLMMDFCKRVSTWSVVTQWSLELLVEKCISSENAILSPAFALRRVFEAVASGILLPGGPEICDPCEKTPTDAFEYLNPQEREDITNSAQHALRMMALGDIYKVLGMDPFPDSPMAANKSNKRKRVSSS